MAEESSVQELETAGYPEMLGHHITSQKIIILIFCKLWQNEFIVCFVYGMGHFVGCDL